MRNLLNPRWLIIVNTLPILIVCIIYARQYNIISTELNVENKNLWAVFGFTIIGIAIANFLYALFLNNKNQEVPILYCLIAIPVYIAYIYLYSNHAHNLIPFTVPNCCLLYTSDAADD